MKLALVGLALLGIITAAPAEAQRQPFVDPDGFAGLKWFSPLSEAEKVFQIRSVEKKSDKEMLAKCWVTVGGMILDSTATFLDGRFVGVLFFGDSNYVETLSDAFKQRYGDPRITLGTSMVWTGPTNRVTITLNTTLVRAGDQRVFVGSVLHKDLTEHRAKLKKEDAGRAAKDL